MKLFWRAVASDPLDENMLHMQEASVLISGKSKLYYICILAAMMVLSVVGTACSADEVILPQSVSDGYFNEWGLYMGAGYGRVAEGPYVPIFLILHLGVDAKRWLSSIREHRGIMTRVIERQINPSGTPKQNVELGLGIGLKYSDHVNDTLSMYVLGSVGPHYMTLDTAGRPGPWIPFCGYDWSGDECIYRTRKGYQRRVPLSASLECGNKNAEPRCK